VRDVVEVEAGVAVVADDTWAAMKGRDALEAEWDDGPMGGLSDADVEAELERRIRGSEAAVAREEGNAGSGLAGAATRVEAVYDVPYLAHACMEPLNCMAHVRDDGAEIRVPTQNATATQQVAAEITGLDPSSIVVHSLPMGGGFGRRSNTDFVREAVELSQAVGGPVKVIWSREDDTRGGYYRPVARHRLEAGLDADGRPVAWRHRVAAPSLLEQLRPGYLEQEGVDGDAVAGARELPYAIPHLRVEYAPAELPVSLWWWRSVGHSHNGFVTEGFVDELAAAAGEDPVEFRRRLLADHPRHLAVLDLAADRAGWGSSLPEGRARGVSVHASFGSWAAHVVEVSLEEGRPRVHRVVAAIDCGQAIHPDTIEAQTEGAIAYGLSAALHEKVSLEDGRVVEGNFGNYPILRMREMPRVETHRIESTEEPGGIGELNTPPIAAAVTNALFALTGRRIRRLPIGDQLADLQA
jgi:isoquinoline 1-oxidoreductase beta subunit